MIVPILYLLLLIISCVTAAFRGGRAERWAAAIMTVASVATVMSTGAADALYAAVDIRLFLIDFLALAALAALARLFDNFWPIWAASLQLLTVASHFVQPLKPGVREIAYAFNEQIWSWIILILITVTSVLRTRQPRTLSCSRQSFARPVDHERKVSPSDWSSTSGL